MRLRQAQGPNREEGNTYWLRLLEKFTHLPSYHREDQVPGHWASCLATALKKDPIQSTELGPGSSQSSMGLAPSLYLSL